MNTQTTGPRTLEVIEHGVRVSESHVGQAAAVGRDTTGGVHLNLTPAAATTLVRILNRIAAISTISTTQVGGYDRVFWEGIAKDLDLAEVTYRDPVAQ